MRAQGEAQFDALVTDDNPGNMAQIGEVEFRRIHAVLQRFYRMIIIDTGNNVRSTNWQAAVDYADQIVVVSTYQRDVGYSGSWVLDHLAQTGRDELARDAITVLTSAEPDLDQPCPRRAAQALRRPAPAPWSRSPTTRTSPRAGRSAGPSCPRRRQRAWTSVAAAITQTLYDHDQRQLAARAAPAADRRRPTVRLSPRVVRSRRAAVDARELADVEGLAAALGVDARRRATRPLAARPADPAWPPSAARNVLRRWANAASTTANTARRRSAPVGQRAGHGARTRTRAESTWGTGQNTPRGTDPARRGRGVPGRP